MVFVNKAPEHWSNKPNVRGSNPRLSNSLHTAIIKKKIFFTKWR